jgi:hypothetical protein
MATSYTTLLGFALPTTGELSGTWGDVVNASITQLVEDSVAGVATTSVASGDWTLTTTGSGADNQARKAILIPTGSSGTTRNINAPKSSKAYFVINSSTGSVVVRGGPTSPTTGVTVTAGSQAIVAWNGSDFVNLTPAVTGYLPTTGGTMTGNIVFNSGQPLGTPSSGTLSSCTVDGTDSVGFRNIPVNSQSAAYTAVLADSGKCIFHPSTDANARTFTIPANGSVAYPIGTAISFVNMTSQVVSIAITTDTMYLAGTGTTGTRSLAQYGTATALKLTSTTWIISGAGLT